MDTLTNQGCAFWGNFKVRYVTVCTVQHSMFSFKMQTDVSTAACLPFNGAHLPYLLWLNGTLERELQFVWVSKSEAETAGAD